MCIDIPAQLRRLLLVIILLPASYPFPGQAAAENDIRIIQLRNRPAQEIIPLIRPLLAPGDVIKGMDYRLIVRTSAKNMREIERLLQQLDVARRNLTITVKQAVVTADTRTTHALSGEKQIGRNTRITLPEKTTPDDSGLVIGGNRPDSLRYRAKRGTTVTRGNRTQILRVLDGQRAYIRVGQSIPHVQQILALTGHQAIIEQGVVLQNVTTGFDVLPRLRGDRVLLEITPRLSSLEDPAIGLVNFQELTTTVTAKLGEWIDLGQITNAGNTVNRAILDSASAQSNERRTILIKVE